MTVVAASGRLADPVAEALRSAIQRFHAGCPVRQDQGDHLIRDILDELGRVLIPLDRVVGAGLVGAFLDRSPKHLSTRRLSCGNARRLVMSNGCTAICICAISC